jgi:hypothetical protein
VLAKQGLHHLSHTSSRNCIFFQNYLFFHNHNLEKKQYFMWHSTEIMEKIL